MLQLQTRDSPYFGKCCVFLLGDRQSLMNCAVCAFLSITLDSVFHKISFLSSQTENSSESLLKDFSSCHSMVHSPLDESAGVVVILEPSMESRAAFLDSPFYMCSCCFVSERSHLFTYSNCILDHALCLY